MTDRTKPLVIGLDIGTTSTTGILVELPGRVVAVATRPTTLSSPHPGWAEEDPLEWWANSCSVLRELTEHVGDRTALAGLCVTGMVPAVVLLDRDGDVLRPSIQQSDGRSAAEVAELAAEIDEQAFLAKAGNGVNQQLLAAKSRWLERHEPDAFARIATVFGSYDYVNWRLTGVRGVERNFALEAGLIDVATGRLDDGLIALIHIPPSAIPPVHLPHERLGAITIEAEAATGLPHGLPVFGGAADHIASALAAGIVEPGDVLLKFGGAGDIIMAAEKARPDWRLFLDYHLVPGLFAPNGCMAASGSALNWLASLIGSDVEGGKPHAHLDQLAAEVPAGSDGVLCLPYFLGEKTPIQDPLARGTFTGLSLGHGPGHLWRALLEAVAYGFRHHVEVFAELGYAPKRFFASDGGSQSRLWMQIMADVLQRPVRLLGNPYGSCVGAAWVAAIGSGQDVQWTGVQILSGLGETIEPMSANVSDYDRGYAEFRNLYETLKPVFRSRAAP
jgi:xylulokinase